MLEILQRHRPLADAVALRQRRARGLVAHVRAVRQVVGAELANEELVEEGGLVARAARGVERGVVRRRQRPQLLADQIERVVPRDRLVVGAALTEQQRLAQPPLRVEPLVGLRGEGLDRPFGEEVGADDPVHPFVRDRLRAVLAELEAVPLAVGGRPGAALAVEPVLLIDLEEGPHRLPHTHLRQRDPERAGDRGQAGRRPRWGADLGEVILDRRLRLLRGDVGMHRRLAAAIHGRLGGGRMRLVGGPGGVRREEARCQQGDGVHAGRDEARARCSRLQPRSYPRFQRSFVLRHPQDRRVRVARCDAGRYDCGSCCSSICSI